MSKLTKDSEISELTIVIASYKSSLTLRNCLLHLRKQKTSVRFKTQVVHSGDEPMSQSLIEEFSEVNFHIVQERWLPSRARNWGLMNCISEWLMYLDSDCLLASEYIEKMMSYISIYELDGIGGHVLNANPNHLPGYVMHQLEFGEWARNETLNIVRNFPTCNAIYRRSALIKVGVFSHIYPGEDTLMNFRLSEAGYKLYFYGGIGVYHIHQKNWVEVINYNYLHGLTYGFISRLYQSEGYELHKFPKGVALILIIIGRYVRNTRRAYVTRNSLVIWLLCTPYTLLCLLSWALGFVNNRKIIENKNQLDITVVENLKL